MASVVSALLRIVADRRRREGPDGHVRREAWLLEASGDAEKRAETVGLRLSIVRIRMHQRPREVTATRTSLVQVSVGLPKNPFNPFRST